MNIDKIGEIIGNQGMAITESAILLLLFWHFGRDGKKCKPKKEALWDI